MISPLPSHVQILVVGGGPAGSYCASILAREGFSVVILEAATFPRYHIGESMLPSIRPFLKFSGADDKVASHGFCPKPGAAVKFQQHKREGYTDFSSLSGSNNGYNAAAWNVRSEFDEILLRHAEELGAKVFENHRVARLIFADNNTGKGRPIRAEFKCPDGELRSISFDYLVDASGRAGIMSTKYLKNRKMNNTLRNVASWGYWTGAKRYMPGSQRDNAPFFEALTDGSGWAWFIPLHDGTVSVGIVTDQASGIARKALSASNGVHYSTKDDYLAQLRLAPTAVLQGEGSRTRIHSASDYSYAADRYSGDHFRLIGDASAFIDPFFSSGVHLALLGALTAAASISASIRKTCSELQAAQFHDKKVAIAYTRFLLVVMGVYKQIRNQDLHILAEVDEDNFDRAFDILRPVIQGTADVGKTISEVELQKTMDFCKDIFAPTDPQMHEAVGARLGPELCSPSAPIMTDHEIEALAQDDNEAKLVLKEINARKAVHTMYDGPIHVAAESVDGLVLNLQVGNFGLKNVQ
ncbi:FAD/NAD-binding domain-containing protein [Guyanagaster necrorhizus]|uniref:FAD/NAD-binding domain-containing protein n=1 Tax=Guyanagaster necrorhizus TaxID=856835 RepID=A0A9P8AP40_9AGAR|nr:FAD/NAD-binding domain-containing protein [Guyanagaster necrorhizus MCA 3950]KAG7442938.1 FAD/NAD-binding domain-containing protein [Guyanagaster necrorhizus MCA 3950]